MADLAVSEATNIFLATGTRKNSWRISFHCFLKTVQLQSTTTSNMSLAPMLLCKITDGQIRWQRQKMVEEGKKAWNGKKIKYIYSWRNLFGESFILGKPESFWLMEKMYNERVIFKKRMITAKKKYENLRIITYIRIAWKYFSKSLYSINILYPKKCVWGGPI